MESRTPATRRWLCQATRPAQASGIKQFLEMLKNTQELHDQDRASVVLDQFLEMRRGQEDLLTFVNGFVMAYEEAQEHAGLTVNNVGLSHMLLSRCGLPQKKIDDILLHVGGDREQYDVIRSLTSRMAKQDVAHAHPEKAYHGQHDHYDDDYDNHDSNYDDGTPDW